MDPNLLETPSEPLQIALRLGVALGLGLVLGVERELRGKEAGLKTMSMVSMGSAGFMIAGLQLIAQTDPPGDASRLISGLAAAIGFLGAGVILRRPEADPGEPHAHQIRGLTTAATIFVACAVGASAGAGLFWTAGIMTAAAGTVLIIGRKAERPVRKKGDH